MRTDRPRLIIDTNAVLRSQLSETSASAALMRACEKRMVLMPLSRPVLAEYRKVLTDPGFQARSAVFARESVERLIARFRQRLPDVLVMDAATFVREHPELFER